MKIRILYISICCIVFPFALFSQHKNIEVSTGYNVFYYPSGQISSEGFMKQGNPVGLWKSFYPDGIVKSIGKRTNGQLDSIWSFYAENGALKEQISYLDGKKNGYYLIYNY